MKKCRPCLRNQPWTNLWTRPSLKCNKRKLELNRYDGTIFNCVESNPVLLWFCLTLLCDWSRKLASLSLPIRYTTTCNQSQSRFLGSFNCLHFEFSLALTNWTTKRLPERWCIFTSFMCDSPIFVKVYRVFLWQWPWYTWSSLVVLSCETIIVVNTVILYYQMSSFVRASAFRNDEGPTLETSALKLFPVANLRYQLSW